MPDSNGDSISQIEALATALQAHMQEVHQTMLTRRAGATVGSDIIKQAIEGAAGWKDIAQQAIDLAAQFATHGADLGFVFAYHGMDLGYQFASKGEAVGPMANRILFMAVQIGVMADRIGEMADRILFMADKIGEFGDKILYESQLIVYTEQLIVSESVLIEHTIRVLSEMTTDLAAIINHNDAYFEYKKAIATQQTAIDPYQHIYANMNLMLKNMHEFSLAMLAKEAADRERELKVRENQVDLREATMSANDCYCPGFYADQAPDTPLEDDSTIPPEPEVPKGDG
jgi:hypothetical protein